MSGAKWQRAAVSPREALEEAWFLGLRLNRGVSREALAERYGAAAAESFRDVMAELSAVGLVEEGEDRVWLTARGRLLSNEVFQRFLGSVSPR